MSKDVMIDIETIGLGKNSAILSIAAVRFDITKGGEFISTFYQNVDVQSCIDQGMTADGDALYFWLGENDKTTQQSRDVLFDDRKHISEVLASLKDFINEDDNIWCHATFDAPILEDVYRKNNVYCPWKFTNVRDIRTLMSFLPSPVRYAVRNIPKNNNHHDALEDCIYQIKYCTLAHSYVVDGSISDELIKRVEPTYFEEQEGEAIEVKV